MKKEMTDYINEMTDDSLDVLEKIISLQYRKFIRFYRLVEVYSGIIEKVKYNYISPSSLDVVLVFNTKRKLENIKIELEDSMKKNGYDGTIEVAKKNMSISIILDEEECS